MAATTDDDVEAILGDRWKLQKIASAAFKAVDLDRSGYIEEEELKQVMSNVASDLGVGTPTDIDVKEIFRSLDVNQDGKISLDEFTVYIQQVLELMATQVGSFEQ